jgi:hypothetical protein
MRGGCLPLRGAYLEWEHFGELCHQLNCLCLWHRASKLVYNPLETLLWGKPSICEGRWGFSEGLLHLGHAVSCAPHFKHALHAYDADGYHEEDSICSHPRDARLARAPDGCTVQRPLLLSSICRHNACALEHEGTRLYPLGWATVKQEHMPADRC